MIDDSVIPGPVRMGVANDYGPGWSGVKGAATTRHHRTGYSFDNNNFGKATAQ